MKKRLLLIFVIGISFSPSVFASGDGVGPFNKSKTGQSFCAVLAGETKSVDTDENGSSQPVSKSGVAISSAGSMTPGSNNGLSD
jgi:hypothetical protein